MHYDGSPEMLSKIRYNVLYQTYIENTIVQEIYKQAINYATVTFTFLETPE